MKPLFPLLLLISLSAAGYASPSKDEIHTAILENANTIRDKIHKFKKGAFVEVIFLDGRIVKGTFENYISYDDSLWVLPFGNTGWFSDDAYDIEEIYDIRPVILRSL